MNLSAEARMKRDRYGSNVYGATVPAYNDVQGNDGKRSCLWDEVTDSNFNQLNQANQEMNQSHEQDMEIGYEDPPPAPTFEGLEQRLIEEIMKLAKERSDAEDAEFTRHKERILEINAKYQESLSALRAQHVTRREEFLRKESLARLNQYHEDKRNQRSNMRVPDVHGNKGSSTLIASKEIGRFHGATEYKHAEEQTAWLPNGRNEGSEPRVALTAGEAIGRVHSAAEYNHDGEPIPSLPSRRNEGSEANVAFTAGEAIGRFHGATEYMRDIERVPSLRSGRSEGSVARVPLPPGRVYNNRAL